MSRAAFTRAMASMPSFRSLMYTYVHAFLEAGPGVSSLQRRAQPHGAAGALAAHDA
jgi:hypothetical protein